MHRTARFLTILFVGLIPLLPIAGHAATPSARPAASAPAKSAPAVTPPATSAAAPLSNAQIDAAIATLKNTSKRDALIATLEAMKRGETATRVAAPLGIGLGIVQTVENRMSVVLGDMGAALKEATDVTLIWHWAAFVATDVWLRRTVLEATWRLGLVLIVSLAAEFLAGRLLRRPRAALLHGAGRVRPETAPPGAEGTAAAEAGETEPGSRRRSVRRWLQKLPRALAHFLLEIAPIIAFAVVGFVFLSTGFAHDRVSRLVIIAALEAYLSSRMAMEVVRLFLAPDTPEIRLTGFGRTKARWLAGWLRIIIGTIAFGYAAIATGGLFGLYPAASRVLIKLVSLIVHVMVAIMILQARRPVAAFIRGDSRSNSFTGALRIGLAHTWHILALFYVIALWVAWAIGIPHAFFLMLRIVIVLGVVVSLARGLLGSLDSGLDSLFDDKGPMRAQYPDLHARMRTYVPIFKLTAGALITILALLVTLQFWGLRVFDWLGGSQLGRQVLSAAITIGAAVLIALIVWEGANAALEGHAERLVRQGRTGRAARYRTLLPMLRTALLGAIFVITALVVLSAIGVNVTLLLGGLSIFGLAVGFGSQKLVQDIITGLFLLLEDAVQVGDWVTLGGVSGSVEKLSVRTIRLRAGDGSLNVIPFSAVSTVANFSREFSFAPINVGVAYKEDIDRVFAVVRDEFEKLRADPEWAPRILADLELWGLDQFGASSLDIVGRMRTPAGQQHAVRREFNRRLKIRFDAEGIEIPFNYQRLTIDPAEFRAAFAPERGSSPPANATPDG